MAYQMTAVLDAIRQLALLRGGPQDDGYRFALAWLVGARMAQQGMLPEGSRAASLTDQAAWSAAHPTIGTLCAEIIWGKGGSPVNRDTELPQAAAIVARLLERAPDFYLSVPDALWYLPALRTADWPALAPEACDLLFSMLGAAPGATVWIPFDPLGQLTARALKLGLRFETAGPRPWPSEFQQLCRAVLGVFEDSPLQSMDAHRGADGKRDFAVDYLIAVPPMNAKIPLQMGWYEWSGDDEVLSQSRALVQRIGFPMHLRLDRSDTWAPAALWPRVRRNAVFVAAQSILFARGQEQRLREAWVRSGYPLASVLSLPGRMFAQASIAPAVLFFSRQASGRRLRMADLSEFTVRTGYGGRQGKTLDLERSLAVLELPDPFASARRLGDAHIGAVDRYSVEQDSKTVREVSFGELLDGECNLQPSRYLQAPLKLTGDRLRLRDLVDVIRAPVPTTDPYSIDAIEVGIPELDGWRPVSPPTPSPRSKARIVQIRERRLEDSALMKGDIVMSIKGTVGRTALINQSVVHGKAEGDEHKTWSLVASGNCIALRPRGEKVSSEYLLLYFRSKEFEYQRDALLVGAVIPHVTPDALCDSVQVPIPSPTERALMQEKYQRLCDLEDQAEAAKLRIAEIVDTLWAPQL
jgi:hypothetical protein